ncbi:hypothetical protein [Sagittula sp.]|uniref:hypothetical protein n=1 Tax=Sagittula sp. TaxID=2038081 RepID=UPI0035154D87
MSDTGKPCSACHGRGYHNCDCWPGDCICGWGDETCDVCDGEGRIYADDYDDWEDFEDLDGAQIVAEDGQ